MTKKQIKAEIAIIRKCEKSIYDYKRNNPGGHLYWGLNEAEIILWNKRKRLEAKLKR